MIEPFFEKENFKLYQGDSLQVLEDLPYSFDMIFADPPYFLSNGGYTIQSGKIVSVNKGDWDKNTEASVGEFNLKWLKQIRSKLKKNGTIWVSGTMHNIFSIYQILIDLNFKVLNTIVWEKTNPPPNFTKKFFTHSHEIILWARKEDKVPHVFNYELMKKINLGKQMKDVWKLPAIAPWEKKFGKHPTQKPLSILCRIILASTVENATVLDPFTGSSTTGIACQLLNRKFVGIDSSEDFLKLSIERFKQIQNKKTSLNFKSKLKDILALRSLNRSNPVFFDNLA